MNYLASLVWDRGTQAFESGNFSRRHRIAFDGGQTIVASSSPHVLPEPLSDASGIDPEELLVAALSSCHMLWFLVIAARKKFRVDRYLDSAAGSMADIGDGRIAMAEVVLRPAVTFSGSRLPSAEEFLAMHHQAHERCFIANSVKTAVLCQPTFEVAAANGGPG